MNHVGTLCSQVFDSVEDIYNTFSLHPLNNCTQGTEGTSPTNAALKERGREGEKERERVYTIYA